MTQGQIDFLVILAFVGGLLLGLGIGWISDDLHDEECRENVRGQEGK